MLVNLNSTNYLALSQASDWSVSLPCVSDFYEASHAFSQQEIETMRHLEAPTKNLFNSEALNSYCWWSLNICSDNVFYQGTCDFPSLVSSELLPKPAEPIQGCCPEFSQGGYQGSIVEWPSKQTAKPKRRVNLPNLESNLSLLYQKLCSGELLGFHAGIKNFRKNSKRASKRESKFIGVSRNGNHWQVLKNYKNTKKYIGGYGNELEAAIAYDFYSMVIDLKSAKTNFTYSADWVMEMIQHYVNNCNTFDPAAFVGRF